MVTHALDGMQRPATILLTGHSLGGAMATLAGNDLRQQLPSSVHISCYTFGAPRLGTPLLSMAVACACMRLPPA